MNNIIMAVISLLLICIAHPLLADSAASIEDRPVLINFQAQLLDSAELACEGSADVEAWFYNTNIKQPANLVYAESFDDVSVERGVFRVPLFGGSPLEGTVFSSSVIAGHPELFVVIKVNGQIFLDLYPMRSSFAAIRSEYASKTEGLRKEIKLEVNDIPQHASSFITSGVFDEALMPAFSASKITEGEFGSDQITNLSATDNVDESAPFSPAVIPTGLNANIFTKDMLKESLITNDILRDGDVVFNFGVASHMDVIPIPTGFNKSECQWVVSIRHIDGTGIDQFRVYTDANGVVTCRWSPDQADGELNNYCTANYLTICKH